MTGPALAGAAAFGDDAVDVVPDGAFHHRIADRDIDAIHGAGVRNISDAGGFFFSEERHAQPIVADQTRAAPQAFCDFVFALNGGSVLSRPNLSRNAASIFAAICRCSLRYARAFSRPWPIRSPAKLNHDPLFSTIPCSEPRSSRSPSRDIPSP